MSCGLLVDYSSSSDEESAVGKTREENVGSRSDLQLPKSIDPDTTNLSEDNSCSRTVTQRSRDVGAKAEVHTTRVQSHLRYSLIIACFDVAYSLCIHVMHNF